MKLIAFLSVLLASSVASATAPALPRLDPPVPVTSAAYTCPDGSRWTNRMMVRQVWAARIPSGQQWSWGSPGLPTVNVGQNETALTCPMTQINPDTRGWYWNSTGPMVCYAYEHLWWETSWTFVGPLTVPAYGFFDYGNTYSPGFIVSIASGQSTLAYPSPGFTGCGIEGGVNYSFYWYR
jgi:hypothetical protein